MTVFWISYHEFDTPKTGLEIPSYYFTKELEKKVNIKKVNISDMKYFKIEELIKNEKPDILFLDIVPELSHKTWYFLYKFSKIEIPKIFYNRDSRMLYAKSRFNSKKGKINLLNYINFFKAYCKEKLLSNFNFNKYLFVNDRDAEYFSKIFNKKFQTDFILNGVDLNHNGVPEVNFQKKEKIQLIFLGNIDYYPNKEAVEYIYKIASILGEEVMVNIGGFISKKLKNYFETKYGKINNVKIIGFVDNLVEFYSNADIFICPLFQGSGIKNKVLEAMYLGVPVIGTKEAFSGIKIKNYEEGIIFEDDDDLIQKIKLLKNDIELRKKISNKSKDFIRKNYSWTISTDKLIDIINNLIKES